MADGGRSGDWNRERGVFDPLAYKLRQEFDRTSANLTQNDQRDVVVNARNYWVRQQSETDSHLISARIALQDGQVLRDVNVYEFDQDQNLKRQFYAQVAFLNAGRWVFVDNIIWDAQNIIADPAGAKSFSSVINLPTTITPKQIIAGIPAPETLNPFELRDAIVELRAAGFSTLSYRAAQLSQIARPIFFASMVLIGSIFILQSVRSRGIGRSILWSVLMGFGLFFLQNFGYSLGVAGEIPIFVAIFAPLLVSVCLSLALYLHYEDG